MDAFEMLGATIVKEATGRGGAVMLGDSNPFDLTSLIDAASELSKKGVSAYESSQAADKKKKDQATYLNKAVAADAAWADAEQQLDLAKQSNNAAQIAAATALQQQASADAMNAGYSLDPDTVSKRVAAAQKAAKAAAQDSMANPGNAPKAALMRAWQKVASRASVSPSSGGGGGGGGGGGLAHGGGSGTSWLTKHWGPLPVYGWIGVGVGTIAVGALIVHLARR